MNVCMYMCVCVCVCVYIYTWADHLIPGLIFFSGKLYYVAKWQQSRTRGTCTSVCAKPEIGISPHLLCGGPWVNVYNSVRRISRWRRKCSSVCIDFCFRLGKTGAETYEMLQAAFGEFCLSRLKTFEWYSCFKSGCESFEDNPRSGRPSTSHTKETMARVQEIIRADQHLTIREVAEEVRIAFGTCQKILTEEF